MLYKKNITLLSFPMPNRIQFEGSPGVRQQGFDLNDNGIPITDLTDEEAEQYGEFLKWSFIAHYKQAMGML
jgi:hypothetical protein